MSIKSLAIITSAILILIFTTWWIWDSYNYDKDIQADFQRETGIVST